MERSREKLREELTAMLEDSFTDRHHPLAGDEVPGTSERHFSSSEQAVLSPAACGYLLQLLGDGLLSRLQMELIVHYVLFFWRAPVGVEDLMDLLDQVVFGQSPEDLEFDDEWPGPRHH